MMRDKNAMVKAVADTKKKFEKLKEALQEVRAVSSTLPAAFRQMHSGSVHNIDTPKEYIIWVCVEDLKTMYSVSREMADTEKTIRYLEDQLKNWS